MRDRLKRMKRAFTTGSQLAQDERAVSTRAIKAAIVIPIALAIGALVAGIVVPIGLDELTGANTSNYSSGAATLWDNLDLFVILAVLGYFVAMMFMAFKRG